MLDNQFNFIILMGLLGVVSEIAALVLLPSLYKKLMYSLSVVFSSFAVSGLIVYRPSAIGVLIALVTLFRVFNAFRVVYGRQSYQRLAQVSRRTSLVLLIMQLFIFKAWWVSRLVDFSTNNLIFLFLSLVLIVNTALLLFTKHNLKKSKIRPSDKYIPSSDLPSVSICIPARNETTQLDACLVSVLESDYPNLEVLVLDDCSHDKTPHTIKAFAHKGVRFIPGEQPKDGWLAKNQAYQTLSEAASGRMLIFCGVDVRFGRDTVGSVVATMLSRKKSMISVLPKGESGIARLRILQPMRYWWELALPRRFLNRPPVLSTFWAIDKKSYIGLGGMRAVRNNVIPEGYFARELVKSDGYAFMRSASNLFLSSAKLMEDQLQSSIRTRYPRLHSRPENVLLLILVQYSLFIVPFLILPASMLMGQHLLALLTGIICCVSLFTHWMIVKAWGINRPLSATALFPLAVLSEIFVTLISMYRYEFSVVTWKDRNICIPVMK